MDVPLLSMGTGWFRRESAGDCIVAVRRAIELGVNYFDTSPSYGGGASQGVLGEALAQVREPAFVATKIGYYPERHQFRNEAAILSQVHDNLRALRRDHVDLLQIHEAEWLCWWSDDDAERTARPIDVGAAIDFADAPVMRALKSAREQGLCRFIGISGNTTMQLAHVLAHVEVDSVLTAYNYDLINRASRHVVFPVALDADAARIVAGPLCGGRLARVHREWLEEPPDWMSPRHQAAYARLVEIQQRSGINLPELGIRFVMSDPDITTLLVGATNPQEIEQNVAIVQAGPLPAEVQRALESIGVEDACIHLWLRGILGERE